MNTVEGCFEKLKSTCQASIDEKGVLITTQGREVKWLAKDEWSLMEKTYSSYIKVFDKEYSKF